MSYLNIYVISLFNTSYEDISFITDNGTFVVKTAPTPMPIFDTGSGTYPSISGIHDGTIKPNQTITVVGIQNT